MITQRVILFGYAMMRLLCHIWKPIWGIGSSDNVTTNISERLHIGNFKEVYQSTNIVNYIQQLHKDNEQCTGLDYTEETVLHLARLAQYGIDSAKDFNLLPAADNRQIMCIYQLLHLQLGQDEPFFTHVSQQVYHLRETLVRRVCRSIKFTSLRDESVDIKIPNFRQLFHTPIEDDWGNGAS
jgi:hypothetical protein